MILVRLLLFLAIATIVVAALLYLFKRDRRYLRFIVQVVKFTIFLLAGVLLFFLFERLLLSHLTRAVERLPDPPGQPLDGRLEGAFRQAAREPLQRRDVDFISLKWKIFLWRYRVDAELAPAPVFQ